MATLDADRLKELKAFDDTKAGVKGLVDAGIASLPKIFIMPPEELVKGSNIGHVQKQLPVIDLSCVKSEDKGKCVIDEIRRASAEWGFFHVTNHGIPQSLLDGVIDAIQKFHKQDAEVKQQYYSRDPFKMVRYNSTLDLYQAKAASWKDTLTITLMTSDQKVEPDKLPDVCGSTIIAYLNHVNKLGETLFELLSEALGLKPDRLNAMGCAEWRIFLMHYYPACPEPDKTLGTRRHKDASFLTILLQDQIGGLQFLHDNQWIDVPPIRGSLIVNIGDALQIVSNDKFKSKEHRVLVNHIGPRISAACFFNGDIVATPPKICGPIKELISEERPALYKHFTVPEYAKRYFSSPIDKSVADTWRL